MSSKKKLDVKSKPAASIKRKEVEMVKEPIKKKKTTSSNKTKNNKEKAKVLEVPNNQKSLNDTIQSFTSILFTIVIFVALLLIIFVIYNNYLKKDELNLKEVCSDFIEKDYGITSEMINNYIINSRVMLYNVENYDVKELDNNKIIELATYLIWGSSDEYQLCEEDEEYCLTSKISMPYSTLKTYFKNYLNVSDFDLVIEQEYLDTDTIRLYRDNDNIVLTFGEFEFESLRHNLAYTNIKGDKVTLVFALEKKTNDNYNYVASKEVNLKLIGKNLVLENIKTTYKENK